MSALNDRTNPSAGPLARITYSIPFAPGGCANMHLLQSVFLSSIKTKVAVKLPKKLFFFFSAESRLSIERVNVVGGGEVGL